MSEYNLFFHAYFPQSDAFDTAKKGFHSLYENDYEAARTCFDGHSIKDHIGTGTSAWSLEYLTIEDKIIDGSFIAHESSDFNPNAFLKSVAALGADLVIGEKLTDTGHLSTYGFEKGKKSPIKNVRNKMMGLSNEFALRLAVDKPKEVIEVLQKGVNPNITYDGEPIIFRLAWYKKEELIDLLFQNKVDVNVVKKDGSTILSFLLEEVHPSLKLIKKYLEYGADPNILYQGNINLAIFHALEYYYGDLNTKYKLVKLLCDYGLKIDETISSERRPLHDAVETLVRDYFNFDTADEDRHKLLKQAKMLLECLIEAGDDINVLDNEGVALMTKASRAPDLIELLKELGATDNQTKPKFYHKFKTAQADQAIQAAFNYGDYEFIENYLAKHLQNSFTGFQIIKILEIAICYGHLPTVKILVEAGTNPDSHPFYEEEIPFPELARNHRFNDIAEYLESMSAEFNEKGKVVCQEAYNALVKLHEDANSVTDENEIKEFFKTRFSPNLRAHVSAVKKFANEFPIDDVNLDNIHKYSSLYNFKNIHIKFISSTSGARVQIGLRKIESEWVISYGEFKHNHWY